MFVGGTGATLFVAGGIVFRARNASQIPPHDLALDGRTFVVTVSRGEGAEKRIGGSRTRSEQPLALICSPASLVPTRLFTCARACMASWAITSRYCRYRQYQEYLVKERRQQVGSQPYYRWQGGTSGIGKAVTRQLVSNGARVIVGARNSTRLSALQEELQGVEVFPLDLADAKSVAVFAQQVQERCPGGLHGLINNAAIIQCEQRRNAAGVEMTFAANALGPWQLTNTLLPLLLRTGEQAARLGDAQGIRPRIVNVGSRLESKGEVG